MGWWWRRARGHERRWVVARSPTQGVREAAGCGEAGGGGGELRRGRGRLRTAYCCRPPVLSASMRSGLTTLGLAAAADDGRDGLLPLLGRGGMGGLLPPLLGR